MGGIAWNGKFDVSKIPPDQSVVTLKKLWVKAEVEEKIYSIPGNVRPHILMKLSGPCGVNLAASSFADRNLISTLYNIQSIENQSAQSGTPPPANPPTADPNVVVEAQKTVDAHSINDYGLLFRAVTPTAGVVPMVSNIRTYGPWASSNADTSYGGLNVEVNPDLNPWTYGSYLAMNNIANSLVENSNIGLVKAESGSVTIAGLPNLVRLGGAINETGPNLSSISFVYGSGGVTTTYDFQTFNPKLGGLSKPFLEEVKKFNKKRREQIRLLRNIQIELNKANNKSIKNLNNLNYAPNMAAVPSAKKNSGIELFIGQMWDHQSISSGSGISQRTIVAAETSSKKENEMTFDYAHKAYMSLDGLFGPVSISGDGGLPRFATPVPIAVSGSSAPILPQPPFGTGNCIGLENIVQDVYNLDTQQKYFNPLTNPFASSGHHHTGSGLGHVIDIVGRESGIPASGIYTSHYSLRDPQRYSQDYRFLGLRGPLVLHAWGYDLDGKPVPNEADIEEATKQGIFKSDELKDQFLPDWLQKPATWPVAPVDLRFDRERGLWVSPQPYKIVVAKITKEVRPYSEGLGVLINYGKKLFDKDGIEISNNNCPGTKKTLSVVTGISLTKNGIMVTKTEVNITDYESIQRQLIPTFSCAEVPGEQQETWYCYEGGCRNDNLYIDETVYGSKEACEANCTSWYCYNTGTNQNGDPAYDCIEKSINSLNGEEYSGPFASSAECWSEGCSDKYNNDQGDMPIIKIVDRIGKKHKINDLVYAYYDTSSELYIILQS
ncbi:MAG: hypothetical protein EBZ62_00065 [Sphingobacteriia bacterium]|nr:hypothetical protein [Sphingobacteriia bacterium]